MVPSDWKHWQQQIAFWHQAAEAWLQVGDEQNFERCLKQAETCRLLRDESAGLILVYSGRKNDKGLHYAYAGAKMETV